MGFFESVGWLALIAGGVYVLLLFMSNKEDYKRERGKLIANNDKCQHLIYTYNKSVTDGKPIMTRDELTKRLNQTLTDPVEENKALEKIKRIKELDERMIQKKRERRKVGYKYEIEIFEIFDTNHELSKQELLSEIKYKFHANDIQADELLKLWKANYLVEICAWNKEKWEIGDTLTYESSNIDETDMTRVKWLEQQGKTLKPESQEYQDYINSCLPF